MFSFRKLLFSSSIIERSIIFRYLRKLSKPNEMSRSIKGKVKTATLFHDDYTHIENYKDLLKDVKSNLPINDLEVEEALTSSGDFGMALTGSNVSFDKFNQDEKIYNRNIKLKIVQRKYFKTDLETNLLSHAAKMQIRYLHKLDPTEWSPESLSESFPISIDGAKKLLKSNYTLQCPEKIKIHDQEVMERWEILRSGKRSDLISSKTQQLWDQGKIQKEFYCGNPNLPVPKETKVERKKIVEHKGEFSAIIQTYVEYKKGLTSEMQCNESNVPALQLNDHTKSSRKHRSKKHDENNKNYKWDEEDEDSDPEIYRLKKRFRSSALHPDDMQLSQVKENLEESLDPEHKKMLKKSLVRPESYKLSEPYNDVFQKISKYESGTHDGESNKFHLEKGTSNFNKKKSLKHELYGSFKSQSNTTYRVNNLVYDENGEILYKIPG